MYDQQKLSYGNGYFVVIDMVSIVKAQGRPYISDFSLLTP